MRFLGIDGSLQGVRSVHDQVSRSGLGQFGVNLTEF
jgi:hypothetical protein